MTYVDPLLGKFFLVEAVRTGVVEAPIGVGYFLVRLDDTGAPGPLAVVDIAEISGDFGEDGDPPTGLFFDAREERSKYLTWLVEQHSGKTCGVALRDRVD
jgi:hypothetical protein